MRMLSVVWLMCVGAFLSADASAQALPTYPITNGAPSTTQWAVDRYAPARFENGGLIAGRANALILGVAEADGPGNRPEPFSSNAYNTQGRLLLILDWSSRPFSFIGSLRIPSAWAQSTGLIDSRRTDMWSVLSPSSSQVSQLLYGIIGFTNEGVAPTGYRQPEERAHVPPEYMPEGGGSGRYRVFDSRVAGGWVNMALPVRYDAWTDFCVTFTGTALEYRVGSDLVYVDNTVTVDVGGIPTPVGGFLGVIMQAQNYGQRPTPPGGIAGVTYDSHWSSLAAGPGTCADVGAGFSADIRVTKTASPTQLTVGDIVTFTVDVTNNGPSNATGVVAVDTLPPQVDYLGNTCGASYADPNLTWAIGNLDSGASVSCEIAATVTTAGSFTNAVVVSGNQIDPVTANNSAAAQVSVGEPRFVAVPALGQNSTIALLTLVGLLGLMLARRGSR